MTLDFPRRQEDAQCVFGHVFHDTRKVDGFTIFDYGKYWDLPPGFCPGRDDVSRTIDKYGYWERDEFPKCMSVVRRGDVVIDFGSHIGWYSRGAAQRGAIVHAFDAVPENMRLLRMNTMSFDVTMYPGWLQDVPEWGSIHSGDPFPLVPVRLVKADVEGAENEAVRIIRPLLESKLVDYLMIECSPEFDSYYPEMISEICGYGYRTEDVLGESQINVWFELA